MWHLLGGLLLEQTEVLVGVTGEYLQEHHPIGAHLDHLGHGGIGIVVAHDEVAALLDNDSRVCVAEIAVGESVVHAREVDPHLPAA